MNDVRRFTEQLQTRLKTSSRMSESAVTSQSLESVLTELDTTWEELVTAEEELRQQTDELQSSRDALDVQRQRYEGLFEFAPDAYFVTDRHGLVRQANRAAYQLLGISAPSIVGKPLIVFVARHSRASFRSVLVRIPQLERLTDWAIEIQPRQGAALTTRATVAAMPASGGVELLWLIRDTSERQRSEVERRALADEISVSRQAVAQEQALRREAQEAERSKDLFLSMISHELRAPMTAVIGWVHLLAQGALDEAGRRHALAVVERSTRTQVKLIEDLLDVSRIMTGKLRLDRVPMDLAPVLTDTVELMRPQVEQHGLCLSFTADPACLPVFGDEDRLRQVFTNVLGNAVKFSSPGGRIDVRVTCTGQTVRVSVSDTGIGIASEFLPHIFERFTQAEAVPTRTHGGLGLGLAISRHLVEKHSGAIGAESAGRGHGTTVWFELPLSAKSIQAG